MGFKTNVTKVADGEPVDASHEAGPIDDLQNNILYLKDIIDGMLAGAALSKDNQAFKSDVVVGDVVYWNGSNGRFERAIADGTYKQEVSGLRLTLDSSTAGTLLIAGYRTLDIAAALAGGQMLSAARYYLSPTEPGKLTTVKPTATSVLPVLLADGLGNIILLPCPNPNRGYQGYRGFQGWTGSGMRGYQGYAGSAGASGGTTSNTYSGTTDNSMVEVFDTGVVTNGFLFGLGLRNSGGVNGMNVQVNYTNLLGQTGSASFSVALSSFANVDGQSGHVQDAGGTITMLAVCGPFKRVQVLVGDASAGNHTTYSVAMLRTN